MMETLQYEFNENKSVNENTSENVERILRKITKSFYQLKIGLDYEYTRNLRIDNFAEIEFEQTIDELLEKIKIDLMAKTEIEAIEFLSEYKDDESYNAEMKAA